MTDTAPPIDARLSRPHLAGLCLILLLAAALRAHRLDAVSFGIDELFSTHFALTHGPWEQALPAGVLIDPAPPIQSIDHAGPITRIKQSLSRDTHPPLHPLLLRTWMAVFGDSDPAERSLSVALSLLAILFLFDAMRTLCGPVAGLWSVGVMALAGPQIEYAQEVRSYMLLVALTCALAAVTARIVARGPSLSRLIFLGAVALAGTLTHYWAAAPLLAATIFLLLELRRGRAAVLLALAIAGVLFLALWGDVLLKQRPFFDQNMRWIADDSPGHTARTLRAAAAAPLRLLFHPGNRFFDGVIDGSSWSWLAIALVFVLPMLAWRSNPAVRLGWLMLTLPIALVVIADLAQARKTLSLVRYILPASIGLFMLIAAGVRREGADAAASPDQPLARTRGSSWLAQAIPALAVCACLAALPRAWDRDKPDFRALARDFAAQLAPQDRLILLRDDDTAWQAAITYMGVARYGRPIPPPLLVLDQPLDPSQRDALRRAGRIFVISPLIPLPLDRYFTDYEIVRQSGVPFAGGWGEIRLH